ncbi:DUF4382 domain-containing protein [Chryseobacterium arthrosphaerae]|nr:DUF4382 domain-containing protein [Chryseobacterium arthrosphaerae]UEQ75212.1 DUF4382 domain-containing protein [Chryseobacterium arthrosphaerae]
MRMVLGPNNSIVVNGVSYPLQIPSAQQSGLKFNWHQTLSANGAYTVWIDFDAGRSVVTTGNGSYILKPVIRTFSELTNGQIKGYVQPQAAQAVVHAIMASDTISTAIPNPDGFLCSQDFLREIIRFPMTPQIIQATQTKIREM